MQGQAAPTSHVILGESAMRELGDLIERINTAADVAPGIFLAGPEKAVSPRRQKIAATASR